MNKIIWDKRSLWNGCILASIAHAIGVAHDPDAAHEQSWDGFNYCIQDGAGARGTLSFDSFGFAASFRDDSSYRLEKYTDALDYFQGAPEEVKTLALNETLKYLLEDIKGKTVPVITTAFWGENDDLFSLDTHEKMIECGGFLLERQVLDVETAIAEWKEYYDMSKKEIKLLKNIFQRKMDHPKVAITLTKDEIKLINFMDEEGVLESKTSFEEIGIYWGE